MLKALGLIAVVSGAAAPLAAQQPAPPARPVSGWVGITYSGSGETDREGNLVYSEYPVVVSVDPGSPAARAGIAAGDTIVAFNDRDLRRFAFPIRAMIQPGKTFVVRAKRGPSTRIARLVVAERPAERQELVELMVRPVPGMPVAPTDLAQAPFVLTPGARPLVRVSVPRSSVAGRTMVLAGAECRPLSAEWAEALGIKQEGLLIVGVTDATPAKEAGLRGGDVVLRAENEAVFTPIDLMKILEADLDRSVRLEILRMSGRTKKTQTVQLKWTANPF